MFKAVINLREQKGFTLIELLIVIAIIGILAAIAIPAFLGQREKAKQRSVEASARGTLSEVQAAIDDYQEKRAMVFLTAPGSEVCYDHSASVPKNQCGNLYPGMTPGTDYTDLASVAALLRIHHNSGKEELSPYDGTALFTSADTASHIALRNTNDNTMIVNAISSQNKSILYQSITAR